MQLGLVMIVRNEAAGIEATLRSVLPFIDRWTILDTGSTDGTQDIVRRVLANVHGELHEEPFVDFATTRNRVLDLHGVATTFAIMLSGDDLLHNGELGGGIKVDYLRSTLRAHLDTTVETFSVTRTTRTTEYEQTVIVRCGSEWRYEGRTHEALYRASGPQVGAIRIPHVRITRDRDGDARSHLERWRRDLVLLEQDLDDGKHVPRSTFYLAQTNECLGDLYAAQAGYRARIALDGWDGERYEAMYRLARVTARIGDWPTAQQQYLDAHAFATDRAEPLYALALHYLQRNQFAPCYLFARRAAEMPIPAWGFVEPDVYRWQAHDLVAVAARELGKQQPEIWKIGRGAAQRALRANPRDPRLINNVRWYVHCDGKPPTLDAGK